MPLTKSIPTGVDSWDFYALDRDAFLLEIELQEIDFEKQTCVLNWSVEEDVASVAQFSEALRQVLVVALFERKFLTVKASVPLVDGVALKAFKSAGFLAGREFGGGGKRAQRFSGDRYDLVLAHARELMGEHLDLEVWSFGFDSAKKRLGVCKYSEHLISLSRYFVDLHSLEEIDQVLRHEVAHALAGSKAGHGPKWKKIATEIGYNHKRISGDEIGNATAKLIGVCPNGHTVYRHRKPKTALSCSKCAPRFDRRFLITWSAR